MQHKSNAVEKQGVAAARQAGKCEDPVVAATSRHTTAHGSSLAHYMSKKTKQQTSEESGFIDTLFDA